MKKILLIIPVLALLAAGCFTTNTFTSASGQYTFKYPVAWKVVANQNISTNVLFGPNATSDSGLGGVEVFSNQTSVDAFLKGVDAEYSNMTNVTIDGSEAVRVHYNGIVDGESVSILKEGKIYHLYLNSETLEDIRNFDQIVASFKFVR